MESLLNSPRSMRSKKDDDDEERCCFCVELRRGVLAFTIFSLVVTSAELLLIDWYTSTLEWRAQTLSMKVIGLIGTVTTFVSSIFGLNGIQKKNAKHIYVYFILCCVNVGLALLSLALYGGDYGSGELQKSFARICMSKDDAEEKLCEDQGEEEALNTLVVVPFSIALQVYLTYVVRRLYFSILRENNGRQHSSYEFMDDSMP